MVSLAEHALVELRRIGEDQETIDWYLSVIEAFAGHSGTSAEVTVPVLMKLLRYEALTPLTDDPGEWMDRAAESGGKPLWQNKRDSRAFSLDGGQTYYWLSEWAEAEGSLEVTPIYTSEPAIAHESAEIAKRTEQPESTAASE